MVNIWFYWENGPFIDGLPGFTYKKLCFFHGYVSHNQMVPNLVMEKQFANWNMAQSK